MILSGIWEGNVLFYVYEDLIVRGCSVGPEATKVSNRMINRHGNLEANRQVATVVCRVAKNEQRWKLVMSVKVNIGFLL